MSQPNASGPSVFTPRLQRLLVSGVTTASETELKTIVRFNTDEELQNFLDKQEAVSARVSADGDRRFTIVRALRSVRAVALIVRLDVLQNMAGIAGEIGITEIDEDFPVVAFLQDVKSAHSVKHAHDLDLTGDGVVVAVLDTGVDDTHPDLAGVVSERVDITGEGPGDGVGHGTHVASIVAGRGVGDAALSGVAHGSSIIDVKVLASNGFGQASWIIAGIEDAVDKKADIINMSLGASGDFDGTDVLSAAANWAVGEGAVVVCAAGNCGPEGSLLQCPVLGERTVSSPGVADAVITIGALNKDLTLAGYSSRGPTAGGAIKPDIVAVGSDVIAARAADTDMGAPQNDRYTAASGTSMATPAIAGLIALLLEKLAKDGVSTNPDDVKARVRAAAQLLPEMTPNQQGRGFVSADRLLEATSAGEEAPLALVSFGPSAAQPDAWALRLRNDGGATLHDVSVHLSPTAGLTFSAPDASFGTITAGAEEEVYFLPPNGAAGRYNVRIDASYKLSVAGLASQKQFAATVNLGGGASQTRLDEVIDHAVQRYLAMQNANGTWTGSIMYNAWTPGMYCILCRVMGLPEPADTLDWLQNNRLGIDEEGNPDETWGFIDIQSIHMLEATVAGEIALEVWGRGRNENTWKYLNRQTLNRLQPALALVDPFTQTFASLANDHRPAGTSIYYGLSSILSPPIEAILSPPILKLSLPRFVATWAQDAAVGLMITLTCATGASRYPEKKAMLKIAESQLLRHQNSDGSWYCTVLPTLSAAMGLFHLGYGPDDPVLANGLNFLHSLRRPDGYVERFHLPVWDTGLSILALRAAGLPPDHPKLLQAGRYLMESQDPVSGGVPFQMENTIWPDTDDTSVVCLALDELDMGGLENRKKHVIRRCLRWLRLLQGHDGGFASFQKDQSKKVRGKLPFFLNDPATADVSGHVLSSLKLLEEYGFSRNPVDRGLDWVKNYQLADGSWFGRWGLTYTYGTTAVLQALADLGESRDTPFVKTAINKMLSIQNEDGGWGENYITYYNIDADAAAESTVEQTAWTVIGLLMAPRTQRIDTAVDRGVQFILDQYSKQDGWPTDKYTVGALWVYRNTIYAYAWSLWALGLYRQSRRNG